ncbi:MAG: T9SS type A sorting domain-containing protein [Bacteroidetes bacterium]|nr:T9SS type A sorting domain-containing protein [Bacteroidota bacterium]
MIIFQNESCCLHAGNSFFDDLLLRPAYGQSNRTLAEAGENKTDLFAFDIYPNPANSEFIIQLPNPELVSKIYIINNIGVTVMEYNENSLPTYMRWQANRNHKNNLLKIMAKLTPYLFLPFVLFVFTCKGQVYFNNTYSSGLPDSAFRGETIRSIVEYENDSTYVINLVSQNVTNGELVTIFTKLNNQGVPILSKQYGYPNHYFLGFKLIKLKDGNMLSCGQDYDNSLAYSKAILLKLNTQLDTIWKREYLGNGTFNYAIVDVIESYDKGYIGIGFSSNAIDTMDIWILRTDSMGNQLWDTTLTQPYWQNGYAIAATDDSCYILGCMAQNAHGGPPPLIWLAKMDDNKKIAWSKYVYGIGEQLSKFDEN